MKTQIICGCCGHQTVIRNFQFKTEEFAKRKIFVKNSRPCLRCQECGESVDMVVFGTAHIIPFHLKYITRQSIISNNQVYANGHNDLIAEGRIQNY